MSSNIFRIFNPTGPKEDPKEKRRGQLRRAQQALRDRRDQYTKSLEKELGRTRASEAKLVLQLESLRASVELLCSRFGIEVPAELQMEGPYCTSDPLHQDNPFYSGSSYASPSTDGRENEKIRQTTSLSPGNFDGNFQLNNISTPPWTSPDSTGGHSGLVNDWPDYSQQPREKPSSITRDHSIGYPQALKHSSRLQDLDQVSIGMEFVLSLEEPCLGHIHGDPNKPNEPNGHALTTTAHLFSVCSPPTTSPPRSATPKTPLYTETPKATLEKLLSLSPEVVTDGDLTPVQAWNHIHSRPFFGGLDLTSLRNLAVKLRDSVKCHGFGAVVQQQVLERLVLETLMFGREF